VIRIDRLEMRADLDRVFALAVEVERWPERVPHYRRVRFLERDPSGGGLVEMAAWRPFGVLRYPTWWVSEMRVDRAAPAIRYRHVRGVTRGMDVAWTFARGTSGVAVTITHVWRGPDWPVVGSLAADWVIGPVFIHGIARRTLAAVARAAEAAA
jgi:ribosome-associated toxin RatA of RatAB toxin-antitoxin module